MCYHVDMRRARILLFAVGLGLVTAAVAAAAGGTIRDPADTGGRFDIQAVSFAQNARTLTFTITMWKRWKISDLQHGVGATPEICVLIWEKSPLTGIYDFSACMKQQSPSKVVRANVYENGHEELASLRGAAVAIQPSSRSVAISFPKKLIDSPASILWRVRTFDRKFDFAPSKSAVRERTR